ncbi:tRNA synthetases class I, catalytic domain-containing protein, partial [Schizophyllum fasciatum]
MSKAPAAAEHVLLFEAIGLPHAKAVEAAKSAKAAAALKDIIDKHQLDKREPRLEDKQAGLIAALAGQVAKAPNTTEEGRDFVVDRILEGKLKSTDQTVAAAKYVETHPPPIDGQEFDKECGVGFSITPEDLYKHIAEIAEPSASKGWAGLGSVISAAKAVPSLRWANPLEVKATVEKLFLEKFGPKEAAKPKAKETKKPAKAAKVETTEDPSSSRKSVFEEGFLGSLHKPGENPQIHPHLREAHLAATGGQVWTRFPPEPNGYLHIGHSKAIFVNFGFAAHHGGKCYLRYDDTNPEKEEARYFESILEMVRWLGYEPWKITYSSDYFQQLYELAVELIRRDKAYVCHCTQEEIKQARGEKTGQKPRACAHRTRPVEESLREFEAMKEGKYRPKEANLRMKQDLEDGN